MRALSTQAVLLTLLLAGQSGALAQVTGGVSRVYSLSDRYSISGSQPHVYVVPNPSHYRSQANTLPESYARGAAMVIHARGHYERLAAEARILHAEARAREIENHEAAVESYFALRQLNRQAVALARGPRPTQDDLVRIASQARPQPLDDELTDAGEICWPALLQAQEFAWFRAELEDAFCERAVNGGPRLEDLTWIDQTARAMLDVLKEHVRGVPADDYMTARRFIESLVHEARQPLG
jgi:hypothetical protein